MTSKEQKTLLGPLLCTPTWNNLIFAFGYDQPLLLLSPMLIFSLDHSLEG